MASPESSGRMIRKCVADSENIASLSPEAACLFFMLIPFYNSFGKMFAGPGHIKDEVVPKIPYFTYDNLSQYLQEISDKTSVKWFRHNGKMWLHSLKFLTKHQNLRADRMGRDDLPAYTTPGDAPDLSGNSPGVGKDSPLRAEVRKKDKENQKKNLPAFERKVQKTTAQPPSDSEAEAGRHTLSDGGETACTRRIRQVVEEKRSRLREWFPYANIDVEMERLCLKYRDGPVLDPGMLVLTWFQNIPVPTGIRARMAAMSFADIQAHDDAVAAEFVGQGAGDG